jgi:Pyridine nucleotide-disulphide oxidoreductase
MAANSAYVIVGASLAGAKAAQTLREEGADQPIVLIGEEGERPYERPPLFKAYLLGTAERETIYVHPQAWYPEHDIDLRLGVAVTSVDLTGHEVTLADGSHAGYSKLLLTTGSSPRRLPIRPADLDGVHYLRRVEDCDRLKATLQTASRIAIIGGGWIGLEAAAAARAAGVEVSVLERGICRCGGYWAARSPRSSPVCTGSTGSICAAAYRSPKSSAPTERRPASAWATGPGSTPTRSSSASASPPTPNSPLLPASMSTTASGSTQACDPPTRTSTPPAMLPTRSTHCWASTSASSTGPTPCTNRRSRPK